MQNISQMCVVIFGDKENSLPFKKYKREKLKRAKKIVTVVVSKGGEEITEQTDEGSSEAWQVGDKDAV